jgi:hypothetical protein
MVNFTMAEGISCGMYGGEIGTKTAFLQVPIFSPLIVTLPVLHPPLLIYHCHYAVLAVDSIITYNT